MNGQNFPTILSREHNFGKFIFNVNKFQYQRREHITLKLQH